MAIAVKRVYDPPSPDDGYRVLVDRLWPRGLSRERAAIDEWMKEIAPSAELRNWYGHEPLRWQEFRERYLGELAKNEQLLAALRRRMKEGPVTLLCAARDTERSNAAVLGEILGSTKKKE